MHAEGSSTARILLRRLVLSTCCLQGATRPRPLRVHESPLVSLLPLEGASDSVNPASGNSVPSHSGRGVCAFLEQAGDFSAGLGTPSSLVPARHSQSNVPYRRFVQVSRN